MNDEFHSSGDQDQAPGKQEPEKQKSSTAQILMFNSIKVLKETKRVVSAELRSIKIKRDELDEVLKQARADLRETEKGSRAARKTAERAEQKQSQVEEKLVELEKELNSNAGSLVWVKSDLESRKRRCDGANNNPAGRAL